MRGRIRYTHSRHDQKPVIGNHIAQIPNASCFIPADVLVSRLQRPRCGTEGQRPEIPMRGTLNDIADLSAAECAASKVMMLIQQSPPDTRIFAITACDGDNLYLSQFRQRTRNGGNIKIKLCTTQTLTWLLKTEPALCFRKIQDALPVQLAQCFATASLLKGAVGGSPVEPLTHMPRQGSSGNTWLIGNYLTYAVDDIGRA